MPLSIQVTEDQPGIFTVAPEGPIDSDTYFSLEQKLNSILNDTTKLVIFDMARVIYISSMGLGVIFKTRGFLEGHGGSMIITNLQPQVKKVFDIIKALPQNIFQNMEEVDAYITQIQRKEIEKKKSF